MANDNHASYAKIGFTVFIGVCAIVGTLIYLGGLRGRNDEVLVETYYDKPISGLSVGSPVNFRGVKIGEVREVSFVGNYYDVEGQDNSRIYVLMALERKMLDADKSAEEIRVGIRKLVLSCGLRAMVAASGITGLSRIELDYNSGDEFKIFPAITWKPNHAYIPSKDSLLDSFSVAATKVMNQINQMDFNTTWSNLNAAIEFAANAAYNANLMIESRQTDLARIVENLATASEAARGLVEELRQNPSMLIRGSQQETLSETAR